EHDVLDCAHRAYQHRHSSNQEPGQNRMLVDEMIAHDDHLVREVLRRQKCCQLQEEADYHIQDTKDNPGPARLPDPQERAKAQQKESIGHKVEARAARYDEGQRKPGHPEHGSNQPRYLSRFALARLYSLPPSLSCGGRSNFTTCLPSLSSPPRWR